MLLKILSLKEVPPYGAPANANANNETSRHKMPAALDGVVMLAPRLQGWLIDKIRCVGACVSCCLLFLVCKLLGRAGACERGGGSDV
jgi:hypothetical protein